MKPTHYPIFIRVLFSVILCFSSAAIIAAEESLEQYSELSIQADQMRLNKKKQFSRYTGNVQIQYENKHLAADQVDLFFKEGVLNSLIATGKPAHIKMTDAQGNTDGTAGKITFSLADEAIIFEQDALLVRNEDRFSGEYIKYHLNDNSIVAKKSASGGEQVKMIIKAPVQK